MRIIFMRFSTILFTALLGASMAGSATVEAGGSAEIRDIEAERERSLKAIKAFAGNLQSELQKALKEGGTLNAISVCNTRADIIAGDISREHGLHIQRVSLKNRNPGNAPNDWQKRVLENFEFLKLKGEPVSGLTFSEVVENGPEKQFRFMKAIETGPICIQCHGPTISDEVKERLDHLYPEDKARGFRPGDIRGAFVVTRDISP